MTRNLLNSTSLASRRDFLRTAGSAALKVQLPFGPALPITKAQLQVAGARQSAIVAGGSTSVKFRVRLKGGTRTQLQGWFQDAQGKDLCGAYYADVRRV